MSLWKDLVFGREDGLRASLRKGVGGMLGLGKARPSAPPAPSAPLQAAEKALNLGIEAPKDVTPPDGYEVVLHKDALEPGQPIEIIVAGKAIALCQVDGAWYATSNTCPHAEGPLGEGSLDGHILTCPYHGWKFDIRDGGCLTSPDDKVATYDVKVVGDAVCVAV
jgi:nitrite reductase (NADH) small subunit